MAKRIIRTSRAPLPVASYSQAVQAGNLVFCSGQIPLDPDTKAMVEGGIAEQTQRALDNLSAVLNAAGGSLDDVVKTTVFLSDMSNFALMNEVYANYFMDSVPPARSTVQVAGLPRNALVEIECVAILEGN